MNHFCRISITLICTIHFINAQSNTLWTRTYGGSGFYNGFSVQETSDGGFLVVGGTESFGAGEADVWLIRTDAQGDTLWTRTYGGIGIDAGYSVQHTSDDGFVVVGTTDSFGAGLFDVWLIRTDAQGDTLWTRTYGDTSLDYGVSVQQTSDSGFVVAGYTFVSLSTGDIDALLIRTDANGDTLWTRTYGGSNIDLGYSVQQTSDGGFVVAGFTQSFGAGNYDVWLIRTDVQGDTLWTRTYGGSGIDGGSSVQQTSDGGFVVVGGTESFGAGGHDAWLIRTDAQGDTLWTRTYGGSGIDGGSSVQHTSDDGFVVVGTTDSFGAGGGDVWLIRTDAQGDTLWTRTYGGIGIDGGSSVQQTSDGGFVVAGDTRSFGAGLSDVLLIKTDSLGNTVPLGVIDGESKAIPQAITLHQNYPNPFNPVSTIRYDLPQGSDVSLIVYDIIGREVTRLVDGYMEPGYHEIPWNGQGFSSGIYIARLVTSEHSTFIKMVLLK